MKAERTESPTRLEHVVAARAQSLEDVTVAQMSSVAVLVGRDWAAAVVPLAEDALAAGHAVMTASLAQAPLSDLESLVAALSTSLRLPGLDPGRRHGLVAALELFVETHGKKAEERFEERAEREALAGELRALARQHILGVSGKAGVRRLSAWLGGKEVAPTSDELSLRPLSARTAKRALVQLTRLARVLGARGVRILLTVAHALVDLPDARREVAYTVLRELVDNTDGGHGMVATELLLLGAPGLLERKASIHAHPALASRLVVDDMQRPPVPHRTLVALDEPASGEPLGPVPRVRAVAQVRGTQLRALVRLGQGLPPLEAAPELTMGMEEIDGRIERLFEHAANDGSVFAVLSGEYGAGKTHHLLHLEARALADERPVFRLAVERLDEDLGNPQRHLRRLLESALLPLRRRQGPLDRLESWLATETSRKRLRGALEAIVSEGGEAARPAARILSGCDDGGDLDAMAVIEILGALDLSDKPAAPSYRKDAYARLHLWLELLARLEGCEGPVVILDEAENLYRTGVSRPERRTALRSLAFYCGGSLPRACVVLAVTPDTLVALREEAAELLSEIEDQVTLLPSEDVALLRRRLLHARPIAVQKLGRDELRALADRARKLAREVRGKTTDPDAPGFVAWAVGDAHTPRELLRRVVARTEELSWRPGDR